MPDGTPLVRDLTQSFAAPDWPAGVTLAPFFADLAASAHALIRLAYADGGVSAPPNFDDWWRATRDDAEFEASLCLVAVAGDLPVGFAHCWTSSFVKDIAVHPAWQRKGIGEALLLTAFAAMHARGHRMLALKVEPGNAGARRLYERLGFVARI